MHNVRWGDLHSQACLFIGRCFDTRTLPKNNQNSLVMLSKVADGAEKNDNQTIISYKHLNSNGIIVIVSIKYHKPLRKEAKKLKTKANT